VRPEILVLPKEIVSRKKAKAQRGKKRGKELFKE
jgi:hypothetical protein